MNRSTPGLPVHHQLPEFIQIHVHWVSDAIQPSHPLSSPSPPAPNPSQHQSLFQWVNSLHEFHAINLNQQVQLFSSSIKIQIHKLYTIQYWNKFTGMVRIHCKSLMCHRLEIKLMQLGGNWSSVMRDYRTWERTSDCEMRSESVRHVISNW